MNYLRFLKSFIYKRLSPFISKPTDPVQKALDCLRIDKNIIIQSPYRIINHDRITFGRNVFLGPDSILFAMSQYPSSWMKHPDLDQEIQMFDSEIEFGNNISATGGLQITAFSKVTIEDNVMFATNVHINDGSHGYETACVPYKYQPISKISPITIKSGSWIGQNVIVLPGVTIGQLSIIGANSVVTKSIPDQCIAVGAPAAVVKKWDNHSERWQPFDKPDKQSGSE